jgi:hypothetical protein
MNVFIMGTEGISFTAKVLNSKGTEVAVYETSGNGFAYFIETDSYWCLNADNKILQLPKGLAVTAVVSYNGSVIST